MAEEDRSCFNCKYGIDEGQIWCVHDMTPGNYEIIDFDQGQDCEHWENSRTSDEIQDDPQ